MLILGYVGLTQGKKGYTGKVTPQEQGPAGLDLPAGAEITFYISNKGMEFSGQKLNK